MILTTVLYLVCTDDETAVHVRHEALVRGLAVQASATRVDVAQERERNERVKVDEEDAVQKDEHQTDSCQKHSKTLVATATRASFCTKIKQY